MTRGVAPDKAVKGHHRRAVTVDLEVNPLQRPPLPSGSHDLHDQACPIQATSIHGQTSEHTHMGQLLCAEAGLARCTIE